jgi:hypothetical protein
VNDPIGEAAKRTVDTMRQRMDDELVKAMTGTFSNAVAVPSEPLTVKTLALDMARAVFDAKVFITEPKPDKNGKVADAYVIDNTQMPGWEDAQRIRAMRGEPREPDKTIVFPSVDACLAAVSLATKRK